MIRLEQGKQTHILSALGSRVGTVQGDQVVLEQILAVGDVLGDGDMSPASLHHNLVLNPQSLAPWLVVDPALDGGLGSIETLLMNLEPLGVARVEGAARPVAAGEVGDRRALGMGPLGA